MSDEQQQGRDEDLGALWIKRSSRGEFMTGTVCGQRVVVFRNDRKNSERQPDWKVLKARPRDAADTPAAPAYEPAQDDGYRTPISDLDADDVGF